MPTTWYFRNSNASTGPTGKASPDTDSFPSVPADKNTPKDMTAAKGTAQTSVAGAYSTSSSPLYTMARIFVGPPLATQTLTGGQAGYKVGIAIKESSASMNLYHRVFVYVWRSGSGNVKTIIGPVSCATEHGTAETGCVITATGSAGDFSVLANDRIVVEEWWDIRNTKATSYTATDYYDGTTDVVEATATSDAAGFFYCPQTLNENIITYTKTYAVDALLKKVSTKTFGIDVRLGKAAWLSGWQYRKKHTINPSSGAGTNYQVKITAFKNLPNFFYDMGDRISPISGNPTDRHGFDVVHVTNIVECNKVIDGATRKYLAYDSDTDGSQIRLYYSDDVAGTWTAYSGNPILGPTTDRYRTPSVAYVDGTFHMFLCRKDTKTIERWTSTDAINFTEAEDILTSGEEENTLNPFIWKNPNDNKWYLFWRNSAGINYKIYVRNATLITGLAGQTDVTVLNETRVLAYPTIMYSDGQYWLHLETYQDAVWKVLVYRSTSVTSGYSECGNSPILSNDEACPKIFITTDGATAYLFTNREAPTWYQDRREVFLYSQIYCHNHCRDDFGDVRFTDSYGQTLLDYWREEYVSADRAIFWVEISDNLNEARVIYMYYGKSDATTTSNGPNTFLFFDDFSGDLSKWTIVSGTWQIEVGELSGTTSNFGDRIRATGFTIGNHAIHVKAKWISGTYFEHGAYARGQSPDEPSNGYMAFLSADPGGSKHRIMRRLAGESWEIASQGLTSPSTDTWYKHIFRLYNDKLKASCTPLYPTQISGTDSNFASGTLCLFSWAASAEHVHYDDIFVRKYVEPEPKHGIWGSEEAGVATYTKTWQIDIDLLKKNIEKTFSIDAKFGAVVTYTLNRQIDALFKKVGVTKTADIDAAFKKLGIEKTFALDADLQKRGIPIQRQVDALFKKLGILKQFSVDVDLLKKDILKTFAIDARFGAMVTYTISKQIDALFKKFGITKTFAIDAWFGTVGAVTYTKTWSIDVVFRYKIKLPSPLGMTLDGQLVVPLKRQVWVGD